MACLVLFCIELTVFRCRYESFVEDRDSGSFASLPALHATAAALKAMCTWTTSAGIETARLACGGHGYSKFSGLPLLYANCNVVGCSRTAATALTVVVRCPVVPWCADVAAATYEGPGLQCVLAVLSWVPLTCCSFQATTTCCACRRRGTSSRAWHPWPTGHRSWATCWHT